MKRYLLPLSAIMLVACGYTFGQDLNKKDSLLTTWVNDMARYSKLPCDTIRKLETDAAWKMVAEQANQWVLGKSMATGEPMYAHDSVTLSYVLKERIRPELLK